jgi:hypothetical protein
MAGKRGMKTKSWTPERKKAWMLKRYPKKVELTETEQAVLDVAKEAISSVSVEDSAKAIS